MSNRFSAHLETNVNIPPASGLVLPRDTEEARLALVSNRGPLTAKDNGRSFEGSLGGLATGMSSILHGKGGIWISGDGLGYKIGDNEREGLSEALRSKQADTRFILAMVPQSKQEIHDYYALIANGLFWPAYHDNPEYITPELHDPKILHRAWNTYKKENAKFAAATIETTKPSDTAWLQDYHLMLVAKFIREMSPDRADQNMSHFLHIPFPSMQSFTHIPHHIREEVLEGHLSHDTAGFQTTPDVDKFLRAIKHHFGTDATIDTNSEGTIVTYKNRKTVVADMPISIDAESFRSIAEEPETQTAADEFRDLVDRRELDVLVSRLDMTKGILETLRARRRAIEKRPDLASKRAAVLAIAPGRMDVPAYQRLDYEMRTQIRHFNEALPSQQIFLFDGLRNIQEGVKTNALAGLFYAAASGEYTSLKDGMLLAAIENVAGGNSYFQLILGLGAGVSRRFNGKTDVSIIDPRDTELYSDTLIEMHDRDPEERRARNEETRREVFRYTVDNWMETQVRIGRMPH